MLRNLINRHDAVRLYPRLRRPATDRAVRAVRAVRLPVTVHCLIAYRVQLTRVRVSVHSLAGRFFYGALTAKVLLVQARRLPGWVLPAAGGTLAVTVAVGLLRAVVLQRLPAPAPVARARRRVASSARLRRRQSQLPADNPHLGLDSCVSGPVAAGERHQRGNRGRPRLPFRQRGAALV